MAFQYYTSFKGSKQGQLKGESTKSKTPDKWVEIISVKMGSEVSFDSSSGGQPKGPRKHGPIVITKENGASSPQLLQAHWQNEVFVEVVLEKRLSSHVAQRITLTNATISTVGRALGSLPRNGLQNAKNTNVLETFGFVFDKILVENVAGSTSATDDWTANNS